MQTSYIYTHMYTHDILTYRHADIKTCSIQKYGRGDIQAYRRALLQAYQHADMLAYLHRCFVVQCMLYIVCCTPSAMYCLLYVASRQSGEVAAGLRLQLDLLNQGDVPWTCCDVACGTMPKPRLGSVPRFFCFFCCSLADICDAIPTLHLINPRSWPTCPADKLQSEHDTYIYICSGQKQVLVRHINMIVYPILQIVHQSRFIQSLAVCWAQRTMHDQIYLFEYLLASASKSYQHKHCAGCSLAGSERAPSSDCLGPLVCTSTAAIDGTSRGRTVIS